VRIGQGPRIRIRHEYGTPEFQRAYAAAIAGEPLAEAKPTTQSGSLAWLVERYRESQAWTRYSMASRKKRECMLRLILSTAGTKPYARIDKKAIQAGMDRRRDTPSMAHEFLVTMRGVMQWALKMDLVTADPTEGLRAVRPRTDGHLVWTEDEAGKFEAKWPVGSRERLAFDLALYTGLRRGDLVRVGRQHVKDGVITIRTEKTGQIVSLPILPELAASIAAAPTGDLTFIVGQNGRPIVKAFFGTWFRRACRAAGVPGRAHGLRKLGATRAADNGASEAQLEAIFGWSGGHMASLYTRSSNRRRLAIEAMDKMSPRNEAGKSIPAPRNQVRVRRPET
jgi:integrase